MDKFNPDANDTTKPVDTHVPHSGVRNNEFPVREYKDTSLDEAVKLPEFKSKLPTGEVVTVASFTGQSPETVEVINSSDVAPETQDKTPKKGISKAAKIAMGIVGGVAAVGVTVPLVLGLTSQGNEGNDNTPPEDNPKDTTQVEPGADGEEKPPVEEGPTTPEKNPLEVRVEELTEMSWDQYKTASREDFLLYTDVPLKKSYTETAQSYEVNGEEKYFELYNPVDIASKENDGEEILNQYWFINQVTLAQRSGDGTTLQLDKEAAKKMMTGNWYYAGDETIVTADYTDMWNRIEGNSEVVMANDRYSFVSETPLESGVDRYGEPVNRKDITFTTNFTGDQVLIGRWAYVEYTNKNEEVSGRWMPMAITSADTPEKLDLHD